MKKKILIIKNSEFTFVAFTSSRSLLCFTDDLVEKYEYCKDRLNYDDSDYENDDSDFGIDNEKDNLFDNDIYGCEIQLYKKTHHRGNPVDFEYGKWVHHTIRSLKVAGYCCFRIK